MRPVMQITAVKLDEWFFPGPENKLLARDMAGARQAMEIYNNLINPAITKKLNENAANEATNNETEEETGYKSSERAALENQLLQIETVANALEEFSDDEVTEETTTDSE
jgi:hypothetical protein